MFKFELNHSFNLNCCIGGVPFLRYPVEIYPIDHSMLFVHEQTSIATYRFDSLNQNKMGKI